ncbi:MAG: hypothetical protein A2117_00885 [Candidatus Wildermuthbacteria bacterium GWA2_46_15]|uniref:PocR domain-containing protein n=1 Tax=Candidatus Wildermuthbacteria bacterium GWA2_46_15 TaxID=1802443 RepID=A0A1G2QRB3_9BACT|nr:MAG: hypothetical protein A2117_00885 [Candidatus Wildermuthbacteria bacterium GWA2_46_15]
MRKDLSEAAQWFLKDFQKILDDFADGLGVQVVVVDREGNLINETYGVQKACQMIMATEIGKMRCHDHFKSAVSLVENKEGPIFTQCYAGYVSLWLPIIIKGSLIGAVVSCGGRYDKGESRKRLVERFTKLIDEIGITYREGFLGAAIDQPLIVTKKEMAQRAEKLKELFDILSRTAYTPLKEVFE